MGESFDDFSVRILKDFDNPEDNSEDELVDNRSISWTISSSPNWGRVANFKRQDSATQKDWVILKSNVLTKEISFAVVGHKGWDKDTSEELPFALTISFEAINREIELYQLIEVANHIEVEESIMIPIDGAE